MFDWKEWVREIKRSPMSFSVGQAISYGLSLMGGAISAFTALSFDSRNIEPIDYVVFTMVVAVLLSAAWALSGVGYRYFRPYQPQSTIVADDRSVTPPKRDLTRYEIESALSAVDECLAVLQGQLGELIEQGSNVAPTRERWALEAPENFTVVAGEIATYERALTENEKALKKLSEKYSHYPEIGQNIHRIHGELRGSLGSYVSVLRELACALKTDKSYSLNQIITFSHAKIEAEMKSLKDWQRNAIKRLVDYRRTLSVR